jgi:tetratricopeptide (TPR) repeat protein
MRTTETTLTRINNFQKALFDKYPPFVVPISFLLDGNSNVVAIYRGAVGLNRILDDIPVTTYANDKLRSLAAPFEGTWFTKPATDSEFIEFAAKRLYPKDQNEGLRYFVAAMDAEMNTSRKSQLRAQLILTYRKLARAAASSGSTDKAREYLETAIPKCSRTELPDVHYDLGVLFISMEDLDAAERHLRAALELQPTFQAAKQNLELVLRKKRDR